MKKTELIWREILTTALESRQTSFSQKELAQNFKLSTSIVFHALKKPRSLGAIKVGGRGFELVDLEKLLLLWATERNLKKDVVYQTFSNLPTLEIESLMPASVIPTAYTAYRFLFKETPADYDRVYFYTAESSGVKERFPENLKAEPNIFILKPDPWLKNYLPRRPAGRPSPPLAQIFVDLWGLSDWYAKEYQTALLEKIKAKMGI